jgi:hypothetical protein
MLAKGRARAKREGLMSVCRTRPRRHHRPIAPIGSWFPETRRLRSLGG